MSALRLSIAGPPAMFTSRSGWRGRASSVGAERLGQQRGHVLQAQPDRHHRQRGGDAAIDGARVGRAEVVGAELQEVGAHAAQEAPLRDSGSRAPAPSRAAGSAAAGAAGTAGSPASGCGSSRKRATSAASSASVGASAKAGWVTSTTGSSISSLAPSGRAEVPEGVRTPGFLFFSSRMLTLESIHTIARGVCRSAYNDERCEAGRSPSSSRRARSLSSAPARRRAPPVRSGRRSRGRSISGGAEAEWCRRPDGARQGPETRFYESGAELASGGYVDGAQSGVWRYRFNDGRNWRAERWDDGALVQMTVDPAVARLSPAELEALGPTSSGIIKLASHDPIPGRETREARGDDASSRASRTGARASPGATTPRGCASASGGSGSRTGVRRGDRVPGRRARARRARVAPERDAGGRRDVTSPAGATDAGGSGTSAASSPRTSSTGTACRVSAAERRWYAAARAMKHSVTVQIAGVRYALKTDEDDRWVKAVAALVDERFRDVQKKTRTPDTQAVAMLTALQIAEELFRERRDTSELRKKIREKSQSLLDCLTREARV